MHNTYQRLCLVSRNLSTQFCNPEKNCSVPNVMDTKVITEPHESGVVGSKLVGCGDMNC